MTVFKDSKRADAGPNTRPRRRTFGLRSLLLLAGAISCCLALARCFFIGWPELSARQIARDAHVLIVQVGCYDLVFRHFEFRGQEARDFLRTMIALSDVDDWDRRPRARFVNIWVLDSRGTLMAAYYVRSRGTSTGDRSLKALTARAYEGRPLTGSEEPELDEVFRCRVEQTHRVLF
jgi:hypothetical protein